MTARVEQNLWAYLAIPHQVNQSNAAAISLGQLNLQDLPELERHFWRQIQIFDTLTFAGLGFENRDSLGTEKLDDNSLTVRVSTKAAMLYVKRCEQYQKYGLPEEWEGVEALTEK